MQITHLPEEYKNKYSRKNNYLNFCKVKVLSIIYTFQLIILASSQSAAIMDKRKSTQLIRYASHFL